MERGILDPRRNTQTNAGFPQETRQGFTEGERHSHRAQDKRIPGPKGAECRQTQSDGPVRAPRNTAEAPHRSLGERPTLRRRAPRVSPHTLLRLGSFDAARGCMAGSRLCKGEEGRSRNLSPLRGPRLRAPSLLLAITEVRLPLGRKPLWIRRAPLGRLGSGGLRLPIAFQLCFGLGGPGRCGG